MSELEEAKKKAATTYNAASTVFWNSVRDVRPDLYKGFNRWDRISEVGAVLRLLEGAGLSDLEAVAESDSQTVNEPEGWWAMIIGSGYRGTVEQLSPEERERVRRANLDLIERTSLRDLEAKVYLRHRCKIGPIGHIGPIFPARNLF